MNSIESFIIEYIQREYTVDENINILELNYVESGYVDSMGLIQFIATIEDEFQIEFSDDDLNNPDKLEVLVKNLLYKFYCAENSE